MYWFRSFLLFYKAILLLGLFTTFVLSCSPEVNVGDVFSISQLGVPSYRLQILSGFANQGNQIYTVDAKKVAPDYHEIFVLTRPMPDSYEFRPFEYFYRTLVIEFNSMNVESPYVLNFNTSQDNQRFSIVCDQCNNIQSNSAVWTKYHSSCSIRNKASNLCINGTGDNNILSQTDCGSAMKWDLFGRISTDYENSNCTPAASDYVQISKGGLAGVVLGSIIGTSLIALATGYWFIQRKRIYPGHALNT